MHDQALWGYQDLCNHLNIRPGTAYSWVSRGVVPFIRISGRCVRFHPAEIQKWLEDKAVGTGSKLEVKSATMPDAEPARKQHEAGEEKQEVQR